MIGPELAPIYLDEQHRDVLQMMEASYVQAITINQSFWAEADVDTRFETGDQTIFNELYGNIPANRRRQFAFNRIRRVINMVHGYQVRNRKSITIIPVENGDQETADQYTKIFSQLERQEGILETISDAFRGALVTGMSLLQVWMDYREDPISGNIKLDHKPYNSFLIDPFFRKKDLSDCNFIWIRNFLTKREVVSLLPWATEEVLGFSNLEGTPGNKDAKFQFMPETYNFSMKNLLTYDEYYYRSYRTQKSLVDVRTGESMEWRHGDEALREYERQNPKIMENLIEINQEIQTVRLAIVVQGKVMYDGPQPSGTDRYPFVPVTGYYNPQMPYFPWRIQGIVRGLRDAQFLYNRRKAIELDILESQINSGWVYKEDALIDPKDVFLSGQGRGLALKKSAQITDVQKIPGADIPQGQLEVSRILAEEINQISGANEELLGSAVDDKAGILSMLRQGAGLTTLQIFFDNLDYAQKMLGNIMLDMIQTNYTPGKVQRIIDEVPAAQFYNKAFGKYAAAVTDGENTDTQRQQRFAQLLQLREVGVPIPDDQLVESATIQNKKKLVEAIQVQQQQQQQIQQMQMQTAQQEQMARIQLAQASAQAEQGLGLERISRIQENQQLAVKQRAEAKREEEQAILNAVRALKELESVDLANIEKLIQLSHVVQAKEAAQQTQDEVADLGRESLMQRVQQQLAAGPKPIKQTNIPKQPVAAR